MKKSHDFPHFQFQRISVVLIVLMVLLMGFGQPALAGTYDTYRSWSYYTDRDNNYTKDDHFWSAESSWQGSSSVVYNDENYAKSWVGFGSDGSLGAKVGVSTDNSVNRVYTSSYYRDDGFQCDGTSCGTAIPLGGSFETQLKQDGSFTLGNANGSLNYYLRTPTVAYSFLFAVEQGEMALRPYGGFAAENLVTGEYILNENLASNPSFFNLIWEDNNNDGVYNYSYDFSFRGNTNGIALGEELSVSAYANPSQSRSQFFDSYNSFHAFLTPDEGVSFYRGGQLVENSGTQAVPEPASILLLGIGGAGMLLRRFRQKIA